MINPFQWKDGKAMTPEEVDRQRAMANAALGRAGDTSPVGHWTQGAARVIDTLGGVLRDKRAGKAEAAGLAGADAYMSGNPVLSALLGGGGGSGMGGGGNYQPPTMGMGAAPAAPNGLNMGATETPEQQAAREASQGGTWNGGAISDMQPNMFSTFGNESPIGGKSGYGAGSDVAPTMALDVIKGFEGYRDTPYWDVNAYRTGYGSDTVTTADGRVIPVTQGMTIGRDDAERDLQRRVTTEFMPLAASAVGPEAFAALSEPQQAALTSIAYNYGEIPDSVAAAVQSGDPQAAAAAIAALGSHNGGVNADRRQQEATMYLTGQGPAAGYAGGGMSSGGSPIPISGGGQGVTSALMAAMSDPWVAKKYGPVIEALLGQEMKRGDMQYEAQLRQSDPMYQAELAAATDPNASGGTEYGLTPQYGTDANGNLVAIQFAKDGTSIATPLPDGVALTRGIEKMDLGDSFQYFNTMTGEKVGQPIKKNLGSAAAETAQGKALGEDQALYDSMVSKMPGLEEVVGQLDSLADQATYTYGGQAVDFLGKQLGMEPRDAAVARSEYIAMVDNQVLPLLRDTFGAAFTVKEGETLRATLGDPNKTPVEKKAVLRAFIAQKKRDVEALGKRTGQGEPVPPVKSELIYNPATGELE